MEMVDFLDGQLLTEKGPMGHRGPSETMSRELAKAAEGAAEKIRASFGLVVTNEVPAKAKAKLKKRRAKKAA